jgi:hypothetical protein
VSRARQQIYALCGVGFERNRLPSYGRVVADTENTSPKEPGYFRALPWGVAASPSARGRRSVSPCRDVDEASSSVGARNGVSKSDEWMRTRRSRDGLLFRPERNPSERIPRLRACWRLRSSLLSSDQRDGCGVKTHGFDSSKKPASASISMASKRAGAKIQSPRMEIALQTATQPPSATNSWPKT